MKTYYFKKILVFSIASLIFQNASAYNSNFQFGAKLFNQLNNKSKPENIVFSPYSTQMALTMAAMGARNETLTQMIETLFDGSEDKFSKILLFKDSSKEMFELTVANKLFVKDNFPILTEFSNTLETFFGSKISATNFDNPEQASELINSWVSNETREKIKQIISPQDIKPAETKLVIANSIYFNAKWEKAFNETETCEFHSPTISEMPINVEMIQQTDSFNYMENEKFQLIELPYTNNNFSMVILLPKDINDIESAWESLRETIETIGMKETQVTVRIPKFKIEGSYELKDALSNMGMPLAFSRTDADFSGITGEKNLLISSVLHKACIEVNELGTEAAAATAVIMNLKTISFKLPPEAVFNADHRFLFVIKENTHNTILFAGQVVNPV